MNSTVGGPADHASVYTLWGAAHSLYSGKLRSYLTKKGLEFRELYPTHPKFKSAVRPAVALNVLPLLELPDGRILQDTDVIIDYLESAHPERPLRPSRPVQRTVSILLCAYSSEGLLPTAMHYRWSYRPKQEAFLRAEFGRLLPHGGDPAARVASVDHLMARFNGFLATLGVTEETIPVIEGTYIELLEALDLHFQQHPYLLGGRPCDADFGFMGPLFAHLARDPVPSSLMKTHAPNVFRWTERMLAPGITDGEFWDRPEDYFPGDAIPDSLEPVLRLLFASWTPELLATLRQFARWLESNAELSPGTVVAHDGARTVHPTLGPIDYCLHDVTFRRASSLHSLWLFERAARLARSLRDPEAGRFAALMARTGGTAMMGLTLPRPIERERHVLVLGSNLDRSKESEQIGGV